MKNTHVQYLKDRLNITDEQMLSNLDEQIRLYIDKYRTENKQLELDKELNNIIPQKYTSKNQRKRRKTIRNIANYYNNNYLQIDIQELLFTFLSIIATVLIMIYSTIDLYADLQYDYLVGFVVFFILLVIWLLIDNKLRKKRNGKLKEFLEIINQVGNIWIFILNLLFYFAYAICYCFIYIKGSPKIFCYFAPVLVILFVLSLYFSCCIHEFRKRKKYKYIK